MALLQEETDCPDVDELNKQLKCVTDLFNSKKHVLQDHFMGVLNRKWTHFNYLPLQVWPPQWLRGCAINWLGVWNCFDIPNCFRVLSKIKICREIDFDPRKSLSLNQSIWFLIFTLKKLDKRSVKHNSGTNVRVFNLKIQKSNVLIFSSCFLSKISYKNKQCYYSLL